MKKLWMAGAVLLVAVTALGATRVEKIRAKLESDDRNYVFVTMHRGDWRNYPENSRDAIRSAIALGADIVELDARITKDGRFVLSHDDTLDRMTNGKGKIADHTLEEIKKLRLKKSLGGKHAKLTNYKVLTLEEALEITRGRILVNIDKFKENPHEILALLDKIGATKEVIVKSSLKVDEAKKLFGEYWPRVESGEILYMPIVRYCWGEEKYASELHPNYLALEPRKNSMYEMCFKDETFLGQLESIRNAPGKPRIWINTMWDSLAAGKGEANKSVPNDSVVRVADPETVWGRALGWGATMLQTDYGAELLIYLNHIGRHTL